MSYQTNVSTSSRSSLACPSEGFGIDLRVDLAPVRHMEFGGFLSEGHIIGQAGTELVFHMAGGNDIEIS